MQRRKNAKTDLGNCGRGFAAGAADAVALGSRDSVLIRRVEAGSVDPEQLRDVLGRLHARSANGRLKQFPDDDVR